MSVVERAYTLLTARSGQSEDGLIGLNEGRVDLEGARFIGLNRRVLQFLRLLEAAERLGEEESRIDGLGAIMSTRNIIK
jgi:hypothetical protein